MVRSGEQREPVKSHCFTGFSGFESVVGLPKGVGCIVTTVAKGLATESQCTGKGMGRSFREVGCPDWVALCLRVLSFPMRTHLSQANGPWGLHHEEALCRARPLHVALHLVTLGGSTQHH